MKLPRSSYKVLRLMILGYLHAGGSERKPASRDQIGGITGINVFDVSRNSAPLAELGILERAAQGLYHLTPDGVEIARAMEFEEPELTKRSLGTVLGRNETLRAVLNTIRIRGPMDVDQTLNHIAMASQQKKSAGVLRGARAVLDFLAAGGLVEIQDDVVFLPTRTRSTIDEPEAEEPAESDELTPEQSWIYYTSPGSRTFRTGPAASASNLSLLPSGANMAIGEGALRITIQVNLTGDDLADPDRAQAILTILRSMSELAKAAESSQ